MKNFKNHFSVLVILFAAFMTFTGCASNDSSVPAQYQPPVAAISESPVETSEPVVSIPDGTEELVIDDKTDGDHTDVYAVTASPSDPVETEEIIYDNAFFDKMFATEYLSKLANLKSEPEKTDRACVVDLRIDPEAYDVDWDYGVNYNDYLYTPGRTDWSKVFDVDYYMAQFPMLALQYHYDEEKLFRHFQTVGIHEGRQGSENFNVGAFMDWCDENLEYTKDAFQGDYAMYYMFYVNAVDEYPDSFPADGRPAQYKTVMTKAQVREFNGINRLRKEAGLDPYIFDAEMAAFANYRAYENSNQKLTGHEWLDMSGNQDILDHYFASLHTDLISENTIETGSATVMNWFMDYKKSQPHYEAMINADYYYSGSSNLYVCAMEFKGCDLRSSQFDIFAISITTPTNP